MPDLMKRWLGYILFSLGAVVLFLYLLFPAKSVKDYIAYQMRRIDPQLTLTAKDPLLRLPPGIKLQDADIRFDKKPLIRLESLSLFPRILTLFTSQRTFRFRGRAYQGETTGDLFLAKDGKWRIKGTGSGFQAELTPAVAWTSQGSLSGTVAGKYEFSVVQGTLSATISNGAFTLTEPLLEIKSIDFTQLTLDAEIEQSRMKIKKVQITGPEINGDLAGQVMLRRPLNDSILDISGLIKPHPLFLAELRKKLPPGFLSDQIVKKGITFKIGGTVKEPEMTF